jgi:aspartate/methionine/tyrosine aminotransferase
VINLSDAHCRQPQTESEQRIVARLSTLFAEAQAIPQLELESELIAVFMRLAGEGAIVDTRRHLLSYSSSCAITMVASYCTHHRKRVVLIEPVFDNIPSILRREGVDVTPVREAVLEEGCTGLGGDAGFDVLWVVMPNNPTGWTLTRTGFENLVQCCARNGWTLVLDMSFRFFSTDLATWSQYEVLESSGISYLVVEDTGKTWSTNELKVGMTVCSLDLYEELYRLHDDLLQGVSPFSLRLLTEFISDSWQWGLESAVLERVQEGRRILRSSFADIPVEFMTSMDSPVSVDWIRLGGDLDGEVLSRAVAAEGVHILPGVDFFWSDPEQGRPFIRLPLARDPELLRCGAPIIQDVARRLWTGSPMVARSR